LGIILIAYLRLIGKQLLLILLVLGFVVTDGMKYVHFDPLLTFLTTGFVIRNLSRQGEKLLAAVSRTSGVVFVVFFATAGVHLDLAELSNLWIPALAFFGVRFAGTVLAGVGAARLGRDEPAVKRYGFAPLLSQAGLTLAIAQTVEREFPQLGGGFRSLVIATVAVNEIVGPIVFKWALEREGEISRDNGDSGDLPHCDKDGGPKSLTSTYST
jgi:Kef-type K+ transport system membrane component KefB